jgi:hypothetical protein
MQSAWRKADAFDEGGEGFSFGEKRDGFADAKPGSVVFLRVLGGLCG